MSIFSISPIAFEFASTNAKAEFFELKKGNITLKLTNWGATIVSLIIPDKTGKPVDVVLGYDTIAEYEKDTEYFGATVGRVANRIGGAQFKLNGKVYKLVANEGKNTIHGGPKGFSKVLWKAIKNKKDGPTPSISFAYNSPDGDQGFPGAIRATVTYSIIADNQFSIIMKAKSLDKKPTPVSLAQHTYWNLAGHNSGDILNSKLQIKGQFYTVVDNDLIPTGQILYARGTAYDFTEEYYELKPVGKRITLLPNGYDVNYVLDAYTDAKTPMRMVANLQDEKTGIRMDLNSNAPGLQFYTANKLNDVKGKGGAVYKKHAGLCLETQWYPDFPNHPTFPQSIVEGGKVYRHEMMFNFTYV
ncbi:hypothetical protein JCGZ_09737 [Jatropha curcas]|uniref:Aldose 1-epimerase n=1 Tax=Jatropha curcas TaxID=180498 RepID=A0A067LE09_JATCU|nr:hypothetical protein JCGZ_09737 [Jatropha curcas]